MRFTAPKLFDCAEHGPGSELFFVEGDSAARTLRRIRSEAHQAILPMQGKPMNAMKASAKELAKNLQFAAVLQSLNIELKEKLDRSDLEKIRYEKFILLFDPDADGIHSRTLMLLFFYRWLRPLLDNGCVYEANAPQWEIKAKGFKDTAYAYTPRHLENIRTHLREQGITELQTKRFRGLANVDARILKEKCIDPNTRQLKQLGAQDATAAMELFEQMRMLGRDAET